MKKVQVEIIGVLDVEFQHWVKKTDNILQLWYIPGTKLKKSVFLTKF